MLDSIFFAHKFVTKHKLEIAHEKSPSQISHGSAFAKKQLRHERISISNDNAVMQLVDNSNGHDYYDMTEVENNVWSATVPDTAYNITFNRMNVTKDIQWNSWSAGGRNNNNAYYAYGAEYGHWETTDDDVENYFHAGDIVYVDLTEFPDWTRDNAEIYVNFTEEAKNGNTDIKFCNADKKIYNPKEIDYEETANVYAYIVTVEDEGSTALRFWRGNDTTLWNCSEKLEYSEFKNGKNTIKVTGWNSAGSAEERKYEVNIEADKDKDAVPDYLEALFGLDKDSDDTDGDGLSDYDEVVLTKTDPLIYDSFTEGIADSDVDIDADGIINKDEITYGTDPTLKDTDSDDINDLDEITIYGTDPVSEDTDGDKLNDGDELVLGFDPLVADTDGNGIIDGEEYVWQTVDEKQYDADIFDDNIAVPVEVSVSAQGNINKNISVLAYEDYLKGEERSYVGKAISIENTDMTDGSITFEISSSYKVKTYDVDSSITNGLIICYNDGETTYPLDTVYDEETRRISAKVSKAGVYFVMDVMDWVSSLGINYNDIESLDESISSDEMNLTSTYSLAATGVSEDTDSDIADGINVSDIKINGQTDIVFIVDTTGSMGSYIGNVKDNLNAFVDEITAAGITPNFALVEYKDITCDGEGSTNIKKNSDNTNWYTDVSEFKMQIGNLNVAGGGDGPETAIDAMEMARNLDMRGSAQKFFVLVTDADYKINNRYGIESVNTLVDNLKNDGINVSVVSNTGYSETYKSIYEQTGGMFANISGGFKAKLLEIASLINEETNNGYWVALNGLIPKVVKLKEQPSLTGTADTDNDSLLDNQELDIVNEAISLDIRPFLNKLGFNFKIDKAIPVYNYFSDPTKEDTDGDGLLDGKARYINEGKYNEEKVAPKDSQPKIKNGTKTIWDTHVSYKSETTVPDEYDSEAWDSLSGFDKKIANKLVETILKLRNSVDEHSSAIRKTALWIKDKCEGNAMLGAYILNFIYDDQGTAYHSQPDTWQRSFGYNDFYDDIFRIGSYMDKGRLRDKNNEYALWMWKGDYWNLQSGTEIGLYKYSDKHSGIDQYDAVDFEVPMQLYLYYYDNDSYDNVFGWEPDQYTEKQWWVTGFNPEYKEANPKKMVTIGKVDLSKHRDVYESLKNSNNYLDISADNLIFDDSDKCIWIIWE